MKKSEASVTTILGMRNSGKSTLTSKLAGDIPRKIIFDLLSEWNGDYFLVYSFDEFANIWKENFHKSQYTIVVRFPDFAEVKDIVDLQTKITKLIYITGRDSELDVCLIFEEAQFYFPNSGLHPVNMHLFTTGRHAHISIILNTQRPALISKLVISQSADIYIGKLYEANDIAYLRDTVGDLAFEATTLKNMEFIHYPIGHPENIVLIEL